MIIVVTSVCFKQNFETLNIKKKQNKNLKVFFCLVLFFQWLLKNYKANFSLEKKGNKKRTKPQIILGHNDFLKKSIKLNNKPPNWCTLGGSNFFLSFQRSLNWNLRFIFFRRIAVASQVLRLVQWDFDCRKKKKKKKKKREKKQKTSAAAVVEWLKKIIRFHWSFGHLLVLISFCWIRWFNRLIVPVGFSLG